MTIEVAMPVYRPSGRLEAVLTALALQTYKDFYITIYNDTPKDESEELCKDEAIVERIKNKYGLSISMNQNEYNLGYMGNMRQIFENSTGDIVFLLADDDIVSRDCIELLADAFDDPRVGCVSRPYYWFIDDFRKAVRFKGRISGDIKKISLLDSPLSDVIECMSATDQLSGLGFRRNVLGDKYPFVEDMFTVHVYPFLFAFSKSLCAYMPHPTVAVSINTSQSHSDIYDSSPAEQWFRLYNTVLEDKKFTRRRTELIGDKLSDYVGMAQIKNYGTYRELLREIINYAKFRTRNLLNPLYYIYSLGSLVIPRKMLIWMIDWYKNNFLAKILKTININYSDFPFEKVEEIWSFPTENERLRK